MQVIDGRSYFQCHRCRRAVVTVATVVEDEIAKRMSLIRWRPDPDRAGEWICPECSGTEPDAWARGARAAVGLPAEGVIMSGEMNQPMHQIGVLI